jgi:hypothetical protein
LYGVEGPDAYERCTMVVPLGGGEDWAMAKGKAQVEAREKYGRRSDEYYEVVEEWEKKQDAILEVFNEKSELMTMFIEKEFNVRPGKDLTDLKNFSRKEFRNKMRETDMVSFLSEMAESELKTEKLTKQTKAINEFWKSKLEEIVETLDSVNKKWNTTFGIGSLVLYGFEDMSKYGEASMAVNVQGLKEYVDDIYTRMDEDDPEGKGGRYGTEDLKKEFKGVRDMLKGKSGLHSSIGIPEYFMLRLPKEMKDLSKFSDLTRAEQKVFSQLDKLL